MLIAITKFEGEVPAVASRLLKPGYAKQALNAKLQDGDLAAFKSLLPVTAAQVVGLQSFRKYGSFWLQFAADVDVIRAPIAGDTESKILYTGAGEPRITDATLATAGVGPYPTSYYKLGVPAPVSAIIAGVTGAADANPTTEYRSYVYTYVNSYGQEGPPSPPSNDLTWQTGQAVSLANMSGAPQGAYNMTAKRIYRVNAGVASAEFQFVTEVGIGIAGIADNILSENLGEVLATATYEPPPAGLQGIIELPNGGAAGFVGNEVFLCEPWACQAWPYSFSTHDPIVGLGAYGNSLLVLTTGNPVVATGSHPADMIANVERLEVSFPCSSKRGIVDLGYAIAFPSPTGLIVIGMGVAKNATENLLTPEQWQALGPSTMLGVAYGGAYLGLIATGGFIVDPNKDSFSRVTTVAAGAWEDPPSGDLYLAVGSDPDRSIYQWDAGNAYLPRTWESAVAVVPAPTNFGAAQVLADSYPVAFTLSVDGVAKYTGNVANQLPFRLPSGFVGREFTVTIDVSTGAKVQGVFLAGTMAELSTV